MVGPCFRQLLTKDTILRVLSFKQLLTLGGAAQPVAETLFFKATAHLLFQRCPLALLGSPLDWWFLRNRLSESFLDDICPPRICTFSFLDHILNSVIIKNQGFSFSSDNFPPGATLFCSSSKQHRRSQQEETFFSYLLLTPTFSVLVLLT